MHVPICVPSAEQTLSPGVVQVAEEPVGADAALEEAAEGRGGATEGGTAGVFEDAAGAVVEGAATATFSCTCTDGRAAAPAAEGEGCLVGDALGCAAELSLSPEPPGTVQPMGVHWIPCTLPLPLGAMM